MRKPGRWIPALALAPCLLAGSLAWGGDGNLLYGRKAISENSISDLMVEDQTEIGLAASLDVGLPVLLAVDLLSSSESSRVEVEATYPGIDLRYSQAEATLGPEEFPGTVSLDSGGLHALLFVGYHW